MAVGKKFTGITSATYNASAVDGVVSVSFSEASSLSTSYDAAGNRVDTVIDRNGGSGTITLQDQIAAYTIDKLADGTEDLTFSCKDESGATYNVTIEGFKTGGVQGINHSLEQSGNVSITFGAQSYSITAA